jgi:hypothetical protein
VTSHSGRAKLTQGESSPKVKGPIPETNRSDSDAASNPA